MCQMETLRDRLNNIKLEIMSLRCMKGHKKLKTFIDGEGRFSVYCRVRPFLIDSCVIRGLNNNNKNNNKNNNNNNLDGDLDWSVLVGSFNLALTRMSLMFLQCR